jgi:hypothetical protein
MVSEFERKFHDLVKNMDKIYVRHKLNGKWGNYSLLELPPSDRLKWMLKLAKGYKGQNETIQ